MPAIKRGSKIERAFWDTNAIAALCCHQDESQEMRRLARKIKRVVAWWGSTLEAQSAFSRLVREGKMMQRGLRQAARLEAQRAAWIEVLPSGCERWRKLCLNSTVCGRSTPFKSPLRSSGAKSNGAEDSRVCCDIRLAEVAGKAGFNVLPDLFTRATT